MRLRRTLGRVALLAGAIALCVAAGLFPQEPLRAFLEARLRGTFGAGARVGRVSLVPIRLHVEIDDLMVPSPDVLFSARHVRLAVSPSFLFGGAPRVRALEVDGGTLEVRASGGTVLLPAIIEDLRVLGATVVYKDPSLGGDLVLHDLDLRGGLGTGTLDVQLRNGVWARPQPLAFGPIHASLRVSPLLAIDVAALEAHAGPSWLRGHGTLGRVGAWSPSLDLDGSADLAALSRDFSLPPSSGTVSAQATVEGSGNRLKAKARLNGAALAVGQWPVEDVDATLTYDGRDPGKPAATLVVVGKAFGGVLDGTAQLVGPALEAHLSATGLDVARLSRAAGASPSPGRISAEVEARGNVDSTFHTRAHGDVSTELGGLATRIRAEIEGHVDMARRAVDLTWTLGGDGSPTETSSTGPGLAAFEGVVSGTARGAWPPALSGAGEGTVDVRTGAGRERLPLTLALESDGRVASLKIDGHGLDGAFHGEAQARGAVLERLDVGGERLDLAHALPGLGGRLSFRLSSAGLSPDAEATGGAEVDALAWRGVAIGPVTMTLAASGGAARVGLAVPALRLRADGLVPVALRGNLTGKVDMKDSPLQPLAPLFPQDARLEGSLSGSVEFTVPLATPAATHAEAHVERLAASYKNLSAESAGPFRVDIAGRRVALSDLSLRGPGYTLDASGRFGLGDRDPVAVDVATTLDLAGIPSPPGWSVAGRVAGRVAISGSRAAPLANGAVDLTGISVRAATGGAVSLAEGRVELAGNVVTLNPAQLRIGAGSATVAGRAPWGALSGAMATGCETSELSAEWSNVEVGDLLAWRSSGATPLQAALTGRLDLRGCPQTVPSLSGRLHLDETVLRLADFALNLSPADLSLGAGRVSTEGLTLWTDDGSLRAGGTIDLGRRTLDLRADGSLNLRALSPLVGAASFAGNADVSLALQGPFAAPHPRGQVWLHDMSVRVRDIPDTLTGVNGALVVDGTSVHLEETHARLGGGAVTASGTARLQGASLSDVNISVVGQDLALRYPAGLRSRSNAEITVTGKSGALKLGGTVHVLRGLYALDTAMQSGSTPAAVAPPSPLLQSIGLAVRIDLDGPVLIRNRLASLDITGNLTFRGDMAAPSPLGRLDIRPGGHVYIQTRDFSVEGGGLLYEGTWDPTVSLRATRQIRDRDKLGDVIGTYDVQLAADGPLSTVQPTLRASGLSDAQAFSLVTTGHSTSAALSAGASVVGGQAANVMVGRLSQSLGLDEVSVQPELLARETDPGTRFTFGKQLTAGVSLIYSMGLSGPEERFIQLQARPYRGVTLTGQRTDDGVITGGVGQQLKFGGPPGTPSTAERGVPVQSVRIEGDLPIAEKDLRDALESRPGKKTTQWSVQEDADRLRARLVKERFLEAEVGGRMEDAVVVFHIRSGPRFTWRVTGMPDPPELAKVIQNALFEEDALERGRAKLLEDLRHRTFLRAVVVARALDEDGGRTLLFEVTPGSSLEAEVRFPGATLLSPKELLRATGSAGEILASPDKARQGIRDAYRLRQRLMAKVDEPRVESSGSRVVISLQIDEGPAARVASLRFEGATQPDDVLRKTAGLAAGDPFLDTGPPAAADRLRQHYLALGFPHVRVIPQVGQTGADVDVVFRIDEGESIRVGRIEIVGLGRTHEGLVRSRIDLSPGDPLDPRRLARVERRILELGMFARVLVTASDDNPAAVTIELVEDARVAASYDFRYNDQDAGTGQVDAEVRNLFGVGLKAGGRYKVGRDIRDARGSLFLPSPLRVGNIVASAFREQQDLEQFDPLSGEPFVNVQTDRGFQVQQSLPLPGRWVALVGYSWKRTSSTAFAVPTDIAGIDTSLVRDTRDNPLDARRGRFYGITLTYSPQSLGSDITFIKGFAQAFLVRPLSPSWLWAHGYRLGLAKGYGGQDVYFTERFKAGGANSLRGFPTDGVGPHDFLGEPTGGEAVVILNQELRYMNGRKLGAAFFYDGGNVFGKVSDMSFDLKHTLGLGLRWQSPLGLVRLDLGFPLNRDPLVDRETGERLDKPYRVFFSLGQAF